MDGVNTVSDVLSALELGAGLKIISALDALVILAVSLLLGMLIFIVYRMTFDGVIYSRNFGVSLVVLTLVTSFIIMIITSSLILSLGLVGALSIVRFRTAVKEPKDIVFMFWSISVGIAVGAGFTIIAVTSSVFIGVVIYLMHVIRNPAEPRLLLVIEFQTETRSLLVDTLVQTGRHRITSESSTGEISELTVEIHPKRRRDDLLPSISSLPGVTRVSSVTYDRHAAP